jgi:succinate dehydrogenase / fumarate reductase cytochrome b subunit
MSAKLKAERPLSPHLQIYRPQITSVLSILHRITGFGLTIGALLLAFWLWAAAYSPECYEQFMELANTLVGKLFLFGWTFAFYYHLCNGIRHLVWDAGYGYELPTVTKSGVIALIATVALTAATWYCAIYNA